MKRRRSLMRLDVDRPYYRRWNELTWAAKYALI